MFIKKIILFLMIAFIMHTAFADILDPLFTGDYSKIRIIRNEKYNNIKWQGTAFLFNTSHLIYKKRTSETITLCYKGPESSMEFISQDNIFPLTDESMFFNESLSKFIFSVYNWKEMKYFRLLVTLDTNKIQDVSDTVLPDLTQVVTYWKKDKYNYEAIRKYSKKNIWNYVDIFLDEPDIKKFHISSMNKEAGYEFIIKEINVKNTAYHDWRPYVLSSFDMGFFTMPDFSSKSKKIELFSFTKKGKVKKIELIKTTDNDMIDITGIENSFMDHDYLIVTGRFYKEIEEKNIINYLALVRKHDLKVKFYRIEKSTLAHLQITCGQYLVHDNKMSLVNSQEDQSFIELEFLK